MLVSVTHCGVTSPKDSHNHTSTDEILTFRQVWRKSEVTIHPHMVKYRVFFLLLGR